MAVFTTNKLVVAVFLAVMGYWIVNMYGKFVVSSCSHPSSRNCLLPAYPHNKAMKLTVYVSSRKEYYLISDSGAIFKRENFNRNSSFSTDVNVTLPVSVLHNGTLYAHVFLGPNDLSPLTASHRDKMAVVTVPLTKYLRPSATQFNLVTGDYEEDVNASSVPVSHWVPYLNLRGVGEDWSFDALLLPIELRLANTMNLGSRPSLYSVHVVVSQLYEHLALRLQDYGSLIHACLNRRVTSGSPNHPEFTEALAKIIGVKPGDILHDPITISSASGFCENVLLAFQPSREHPITGAGQFTQYTGNGSGFSASSSNNKHIWIKAYSLIKRKSAFYVDIDNSRHYWDYDEGVVRMAVITDPSELDETNVFQYDTVKHKSTYWTISHDNRRRSRFVEFNPCSVGPTLSTSQQSSDFTKFIFNPA